MPDVFLSRGAPISTDVLLYASAVDAPSGGGSSEPRPPIFLPRQPLLPDPDLARRRRDDELALALLGAL